MMDEREKQQQDLMDYVRTILFGKSRGETLATYWKKHNTDYATVDLRFGVKATKEVAFQFMVNNLLNKEYSYRPWQSRSPYFCSENGHHILKNSLRLLVKSVGRLPRQILYTSTQNKASAPGWPATEPMKRTSSNVY